MKSTGAAAAGPAAEEEMSWSSLAQAARRDREAAAASTSFSNGPAPSRAPPVAHAHKACGLSEKPPNACILE